MAALTGTVLQRFSVLEVSRPCQEYQELDREGKEIRIAELFPKNFRDETGRVHTSCYTRTIALKKTLATAEHYRALSYTWGDPANTTPMYLNDKLVRVTENLAAALQHFEQEHLPLRIWADAICINQKNEAEKSHQVEMMAEIFKRASEVLVWLGPSEYGSGEAIGVLRDMGNQILKLQLYDDEPNGHTKTNGRKRNVNRDQLDAIWAQWLPNCVPKFDLGLVQQVFQRPWFRRVWVLQEAAVNENVTFYCGKHSISKQALWAGARTIIALTNKLCAFSLRQPDDPPIWQTLGGTNFIARRTLNIVTFAGRKLPLEALLTEITTNLGEWPYEASDPRDRIFAILGFSSDSAALSIHSNYEKTCRAVYLEVAEVILKQANTLDILYAISGPKNLKAVPSWVPDWSVPIPSTFGPRQIGKFMASGRNSRCSPTFCSDKFGNRLLVLKGYRVDTVEVIMSRQWDPLWDVRSHYDSHIHEFNQSFRRLGQGGKTAYESDEDRHEALWKTPIADCDAQFNVAEKSRPPASSHMEDSFNALMGISQGDIEWRERASKPYIHVMKLESARRRIFLSTGGYYGLGQETLRAGDVICIFPGGDSPFLIRAAGAGYYELIGETYVHGIMFGEYLKTDRQVEEFVLC
jgi:hypothetical protein